MTKNRIASAFLNKKAFIPFLTGGDGGIEKTEEYIDAMIQGGADLIEIGIPFSDPIAEGPVIQAADLRALEAGTTTDQLFDMVTRIRKKTQIPLVFMTYLNPVFHYGYEKFFLRCEEAGIDGVIIPDLPYEEKEEVRQIAEPHQVSVISLIAPTSEQRIAQIAEEADGFLYVVSSLGVTGMRGEITTDLDSILAVAKENASVPAAVGFGIHTPEQAAKISKTADGVIVGSAIVKIIEEHGKDAASYIYEYVKSMKDAITAS
ncbi:MAG: tryptophan synthase subunit alpha [Clostridiales bacterium]|nr:tryptophan synthase subunit alpha [Clostridiales bacterium]